MREMNKRSFVWIKEGQSRPACADPNVPTLYEEQRDSIAGTTGQSYVTPFKLTVNKIYEYLKNENDNESITLSKLIKNIDHHYKTEYSAKQSIEKMIKIGVISEAEIYTKGKIKYVKYKDGCDRVFL